MTANPGGDSSLRVASQGRSGLAAVRPVADHLLKASHQQPCRGVQVVAPALAVAIGAIVDGIIRVAAVAGNRTGVTEILTPQQEFDGMVAGGDVSLDPRGFVQPLRQQLLGDLGGIDLLAAGR